MTQYMPVDEILAIPCQWEKYVPKPPLTEAARETKRRLLAALAAQDERARRRAMRRAA